jgi:hypothetical protein
VHTVNVLQYDKTAAAGQCIRPETETAVTIRFGWSSARAFDPSFMAPISNPASVGECNLVIRKALSGKVHPHWIIRRSGHGSEDIDHVSDTAWAHRSVSVGLPAGSSGLLRWLTSIVFFSADARPLLIAAAAFFPVGIVRGIGI